VIIRPLRIRCSKYPSCGSNSQYERDKTFLIKRSWHLPLIVRHAHHQPAPVRHPGGGAVQKRAVVINAAIAIRPMAYVSLTFDHRILDGASADRVLAKVVDVLQNWM
jgi:hypothetical protein